jgi:hypothetical protein
MAGGGDGVSEQPDTREYWEKRGFLVFDSAEESKKYIALLEQEVVVLRKRAETAEASHWGGFVNSSLYEEMKKRAEQAEAKVARLREYIATSVVKDEKTCNCFPCIEGRRLLEETK